MIIEFVICDKKIAETKDKYCIQENAKAIMFFATEQHISEKSYETICRMIRNMLISRQELNNETRLLKRIIEHNSNEFISDEEIKQIDNELLQLEQAITTSSNYENQLFNSLKYQNASLN